MSRVSLVVGIMLMCLTASPRAQETVVVGLDEAISRAIDTSPDLRSIVIQENSSLDAYRWSLREYFPKLGVNYSQNESVLIHSPDTRSVQAGLTLTQLLFDAGRGGRLKDLSKIQLISGQKDFQIQLEQVTDSVRHLFNQILVEKKKLEIQDQVIDLAGKQLDISRKEVELGSSREIDLLDAETQLSSLKTDKKQSQRTLSDALFQLGNLLGLDSSVPLDIVGDFDADYPGLQLPEKNDQWLALVLDTSKDLAQQKLDLRKQYFQMLNAQSWFLPDISLEASYGLTGTRLPLQTPTYNATLTFSFPSDAFPTTQTLGLGGTPDQSRTSSASTKVGVFDSVQGIVNGATAKAQYSLSLVKEGTLKATTRYSFEKTMGDYRLLVEKLSLQRHTIEIEEKKNAILAKQLELGEAKRLDYLQGETQLAKDRISLVESVLQVRESERTLESLMHVEPGSLGHLAKEAP